MRIVLVILSAVVAAGCGDSKIASDAGSRQSVEMAEATGQESLVAESNTDTSPEPVSLNERIEEMIAVLEAEDYEEFVLTCLDPRDVQKAEQEGKLDVVIRSFPSRGAKELLEALKAIKGQKPEYNEDETVAWFVSGVRIASSNDLAFVKVDDVWYVPNKPPKRPTS